MRRKWLALGLVGAACALGLGVLVEPLLPRSVDYEELIRECRALVREKQRTGAVDELWRSGQLKQIRAMRAVSIEVESDGVLIVLPMRSGLRCQYDNDRGEWVVTATGDQPDQVLFRSDAVREPTLTER